MADGGVFDGGALWYIPILADVKTAVVLLLLDTTMRETTSSKGSEHQLACISRWHIRYADFARSAGSRSMTSKRAAGKAHFSMCGFALSKYAGVFSNTSRPLISRAWSGFLRHRNRA